MRGGSRSRLPDVVRIEQNADRVELLDSLGAYHLADDGRTNEVRMRMERGDMPAREFVRVYRREGV
ncbi:MAG TPA: hypothetical protein VFQ05_11665 [Candidatus Eisenbacteria bacterium]|nr:hypothetical protein [Candidatus Eisenbacteria bacterium]